MERSYMFASGLHRQVDRQPLCCFDKTQKKDLKCFFYSYILKIVNYGLVIIIRLCH